MPAEEPIYDLAHLAHAELLTPKPDESLRFFVDVMGMTESGRQGDSVYLRGWDDYERQTLKLTAAAKPGLGHYALRAASPQALQRRVAALEVSGLGQGWSDGDLGHGPAYCFRDPDGHPMEIYYETEWYQAPAELRAALKNQASKYPARGASVRRIVMTSSMSTYGWPTVRSGDGSSQGPTSRRAFVNWSRRCAASTRACCSR